MSDESASVKTQMTMETAKLSAIVSTKYLYYLIVPVFKNELVYSV